MARGHVKSGMREDLGIAPRSMWEANLLRWFTHQGIRWEFEPLRFQFPTTKNGAKSYLPDFWLPDEDIWIECKGRLMGSDKTRIKRFKRFFPEEFAKLQVITGAPGDEASTFFESMGIPIYGYYRQIHKEFKDIVEHWGE